MSLEHIKANYNVSNIVRIIANNEPNFLPNEMQKKKKKKNKDSKNTQNLQSLEGIVILMYSCKGTITFLVKLPHITVPWCQHRRSSQ